MADVKDRNIYTETIADVGLPSGGYFTRTSRPFYSLVYLLPLIVIYEILVFAINPHLLTEPDTSVMGGVVSFVWIQNLLRYIGMDSRGAWIAAPVVVVVILLVLQMTSRQSWKILWLDFPPMIAECIVMALPLIVLAMAINHPVVSSPQSACGGIGGGSHLFYCQAADAGSAAAPPDSPGYVLEHPVFRNIITGIGAGIYEELVFRLILISAFMIFFETIIGLGRNTSAVVSIILSALLFSLHHHIIIMDGHIVLREPFTVARFMFRSIAGVYFGVVFAVRGFGIAAGTHAFYDIIAVLLNAIFFN